MRRAIVVLAVGLALVVTPSAALAAGSDGVSPGPAFYVNGVTYRTVGTPTDLTGTGAPARSFDTIYDFGGAQLNVATAAPGDVGYNGGRWMVHELAFNSRYAARGHRHGRREAIRLPGHPAALTGRRKRSVSPDPSCSLRCSQRSTDTTCSVDPWEHVGYTGPCLPTQRTGVEVPRTGYRGHRPSRRHWER